MKQKKVYIFNGASRAAVYGIGTYIRQLTDCLKQANIAFEVVYLYAEGNEVTVTEDNGHRQISIPAVGLRGRKDQKYYSRNLAYLLKEFIPDDKTKEYIFHLNFMTNPDLVSSLRKMFKCKVILVAHYTNWSFALFGDEEKLIRIMSQKFRSIKAAEEKQIYKDIREDEKMIRKCDKLVCVAQHTLRSFQKVCDVDITKTEVISNALADEYKPATESEIQALKRKYLLGKYTKVVFFAGRLDEVKGISFLLAAFRKVLHTHPDTHLFLAGDGNYSQWLQEAKDCWTKISFTGRMEKEQVYEFYTLADIGIVSSLHEEFGLVAIEMMMHQLPVIVSDTGGLSEIVEEGVSGLKVPVLVKDGKRVLDVDVLVDRMELLLNDEGLAQRLAVAGRQSFLTKYEMSHFRKKMVSLYRNI